MVNGYRGDFRVRRWGAFFARFSLKEVSEITGLSLAHLRVWKQRGHLPIVGPAEVFTARDVSEILVRHRLSLVGIPPSSTKELGCIGAQHLLWHAIVNHHGVCEAKGTLEDLAVWENAISDPAGQTAAEITGLIDGHHKTKPQRYMWCADGQTLSFIADAGEKLSDGGFEQHMIVDLESLARRLSEMSGKPLFLFEVSREMTLASSKWFHRLA